MDLIVTGATGGIGRYLVECAIEDKKIEHIYCQYRNEKKFREIFELPCPKIISERQDASYLWEESLIIRELYKSAPRSLACVFTMFSIQPIKRIGTYNSKEIKENLYINILNMVILTNWLLEWKQVYHADITLINIDSGAAYKPLEGWGMYSSSKAYINMFLKTVQLENPDIKVVSYEPGVVDTQMQEQIRKVDKKVFGQVGIYKEYFEKKMLKNPHDIARDIWRKFIECQDGI